jgi:hypothetical protein
MKIAVFWVIAPCSLVEVYQRFRGPCCLHHQGDRLQPRRQQSSIKVMGLIIEYLNGNKSMNASKSVGLCEVEDYRY